MHCEVLHVTQFVPYPEVVSLHNKQIPFFVI